MAAETFPTGWTLPGGGVRPGFLGAAGEGAEGGAPIRFPEEGHALTIAPTGAGKGRSCLVPALLQWEGPAIVVDIKGETAAVTAPWRRSIGQEVHVVDPMGISGEPVSRLNPLDLVDPRMADAVDEARGLAQAVTATEPDGRNAYWSNRAMHVVTGAILHAVTDLPRRRRSFVAVRDVMRALTGATDPGPVEPVIEALKRSRHPEARGIAEMFRSGRTETLASLMQVALDSVGFVRGPQVERSLSGTDLDLDRVTAGAPVTVYLVLPAHLLDSHAVLMRLWLGALTAAILRRRRRPARPTLFLVDEAAQLGDLSALTRAVTLLRGYGVSSWSFFQNADQVAARFGPEAGTVRSNCRMVQAFGQRGEAGRHELARALDLPPEAVGEVPGPGEMAVAIDGAVVRARRPDYLTCPVLAGRARPNPLHGAGPVARPRARVPRGYLARPAAAAAGRVGRRRGKGTAEVHREVMALLGGAGKL